MLSCFPLLAYCFWLSVRDLNGQYHYCTVNLSVSQVLFFTIAQEVVIANTLFSIVYYNQPLFDDAKKGKIRMTMRVFVISWMS